MRQLTLVSCSHCDCTNCFTASDTILCISAIVLRMLTCCSPCSINKFTSSRSVLKSIAVFKMINCIWICLVAFAMTGSGVGNPTPYPTFPPVDFWTEATTLYPPISTESYKEWVESEAVISQPFTLYPESPLPTSSTPTPTPTSTTASTSTSVTQSTTLTDWDAFIRKVAEEDKKLPSWKDELKLLKELLGRPNPHALKWQHMHQTWGLKDISPHIYQLRILLPYLKKLEPEMDYTMRTLPRGIAKRLIVVKENITEDKRLMSVRDYARLCDNPNNREYRNCNIFTRMCEDTCLYHIWHPDYEHRPLMYTKTIMLDEFKHYVDKNIVKIFKPTERPPTWVDPNYYNDDEVNDGMSGSEVQILHR